MINKLLFTALLFIFTLNVFSQVPNYVPTNGLVGYWPFNGNANDESGNGNNGTVNGATLTTDRFGNANSAYSFDGVNDFVDVGNSFFNNGWTNYSISCWIKATNLNTVGGNTIMNTIPHGGFALGYSYYSSNSFYHFKTSSNPGSAWDIFSHEYSNANNLNFNQFHNLTLTKEGLIYKYYVNGVLDKTMSTSIAPLSIFFALKFGAIDGNTDNFNGIIDDISIYNRALTPAEINQIYSDQTSTVSTPPCPTLATNLQTGLVGYWPFCGNANDESGNGNNGTVNGATLTTDRFGNANSAYSFDGVNDLIDVGNPTLLMANPNSYTQSAWVYLTDTPNGVHSYPIISKRHDDSGNDWGTPIARYDGTFWFFADDANYSGANYAISPIVPQSIWKHLTFIKDGDNYSIYINGVFAVNAVDNHIMNGSTNNLIIGAQLAWPEYFKGFIDEVGVWNRALTPTEITQIYTCTSVTPPLACTSFLGEDQAVCAGTSVQLNVNSTSVNSSLALLETYSHDVGSEWTHNFSVVPGQTYTVRVSAQFSMGTVCPNFEMDPAYWIPPYNGGVALTHGCNSAWYIQNYCNGTLGMRPTPDVYNPQHTYDYPIVANSNVLTVGFADCCLGDNCGSISFELHQSITSSTYLWSNGATTPTINVSPTSTTTYTCIVTTNGVSCTDEVTVIVNNPVIDLGADVTVCGTSTTLTAPTGYDSYLWSNGGTTNTTTVSANGTYSCTVTQGGCSASDSIDVTLIDATISASDSTICAGGTVTLSVSQGGSSNTACAALPTNLQTGLVGYWPFCGNTNDASGNGNTLNEYFVSYDSDRFGNSNASFFSNGIELGGGSSMTSNNSVFNIGQEEYTIGLWMKVANTSQVTRCLFNTIPHTGIGIAYNDNNAPGYLVYDIGPANAFWTNLYLHGPSNNYTPNDWHYVVVKKQGINYSQYIDGQLDHSYSNPAAVNYNYDVNFRISGISPEYQIFHGNIDDVHIYNRALNAAEIVQHYNLTESDFSSVSYLWSTGATTPTIDVSPTSTTTYTCTTIINGVSCTDSVTVVVNNPTIDLGNDVAACGTSTTLTAPTGYDSYLWSNGATTNTTTVSANGTYSCTVTQGGCIATDSIDVVLVPLTTNTTPISACNSYVWNGTTYTASGVYTGTTSNCVTQSLNLTITPSATNTTTISSCGPYTWVNNGQTYTQSGVYTGTSANCVTQSLNLTITPATTTGSVTTSICTGGSYIWPANGQTYTTAQSGITIVTGCNTATLNLTITPNSINTTTASACTSLTWNGTTYTASGVYTGATANCVTQSLNLTINPSSTNTTTISSCGTYTWGNNGQTYTSSGVYSGTTANCVTQSLNLTIIPNTSVTTTINANDTYTWVANGLTYTTSGIYTGPTSANCVTQYLNLTINSSGLSEEELELFSLYPNPVSDMLYVNLNGQDKQEYLIIDNFGSVVKRGVLENMSTEISVSELSAGLYYFKIVGTKPRKFSKIN